MTRPYALMERVGFEVEYAIVDRETLNILPVADRVLQAAAGSSHVPADVERGPITWSNELVNHVLEFKLTDPVPPSAILDGSLVGILAAEVAHANNLLAPMGGCLLPTGMHPRMNPARETQLWRHEGSEIYQVFDRLFNCRRHGWANLQSVHLNISFQTDEEFANLHSAVRLLLPIIPALAASSPFVEGRATGKLDNRLDAYRTNSASIRSFAGRVIPECVISEDEYHDIILGPIHADIHLLEAQGILRKEFSNARGAIARFERGSLEIRLLDTQECPLADMFCAAAVLVALQHLLEATGPFMLTRRCDCTIDQLEPIFLRCIEQGDEAQIDEAAYHELLGLGYSRPRRARQVWEELIASSLPSGHALQPAFAVYSQGGCLARRIASAAEADSNHLTFRDLYGPLARCLANNELFAY